ncbi:cell division control protein 14 [Pseudovirgaria hyperparasitica]|uniref:Cell division control protein 14 n=1 Tax=Pseudovirgaria hyperparasitica TaxID=470096 RepID=A0A6A6WKB2_9PEZI|nr:cell division control protein 14 [Pseudovirgaria hyperparasitica]KAF2762593.1 cell division control protein 14 [Pseudovirgaria hyperparasitica]
MEALLSLSFDNIAAQDSSKIRKGLRQIEGLLAQICLAPGTSNNLSPTKRRTSIAPASDQQKNLSTLTGDPAFREFFRLQEGFEWNVATRLVSCLERLLGMPNSDENDLIIKQALDVLQGILLLHPPSRSLFRRETYMNLLLDLLDPYNCPAIQCSTLLVLVSSLLSTPANTRVFENMDGLLTVTSLFKSRNTAHNVKLKLLEFIYFYLMPENPSIASSTAPIGGLNRSPSKLLGAFERRTVLGGAEIVNGGDIEGDTRTTEEKQKTLGKYLSNVEDLVMDLKEAAPFAEMVSH